MGSAIFTHQRNRQWSKRLPPAQYNWRPYVEGDFYGFLLMRFSQLLPWISDAGVYEPRQLITTIEVGCRKREFFRAKHQDDFSSSENERTSDRSVQRSTFFSGWTSSVFGDFAALVSSCNDIVSAGVPQALQEIAFILNRDYGSK